MTDLKAFSAALAALVQTAAGSVVAVGGSASGLVWRPGVVVTTERAVRDPRVHVHLPDGRAVRAELLGRDPGRDLAVLRAEGADSPGPRADLDALQVGQLVLAVARSAQDGAGTSMGVLASVAGPWHTWRGSRIDRFVQPDLALYPGYGGSALVDAEGRVIGMNTSALARTGVRTVPADTLDRLVGEILEEGRVSRPYAGVSLHPVELPARMGRRAGVLVLGLDEGGPGDQAGLLPGDILVEAGGAPLEDVADLLDLLGRSRVGETVPLTVLRGGQPVQVGLTLGNRG